MNYLTNAVTTEKYAEPNTSIKTPAVSPMMKLILSFRRKSDGGDGKICECISLSCMKEWAYLESYAFGYMDAINIEDFT